MNHFYYNILLNAKIKNVLLGLITISATVLFILYINTAEQNLISNYIGIVFAFSLIAGLYLLGRIPFGQILESNSNKEIVTYYKLGSLKFNYKTLGRPLQVILKQDETKYYCLTLEMSEQQNWIIEKYPTLNEGNARLAELKSILDE